MSHPPCGHRRLFMRRAAGLSAMTAASIALPMAAAPARAAGVERRLSFVHLHTGERLALAFRPDDAPPPEAQRQLDRFLRDHYSGEVGRMDPRLFMLLDRVQRRANRPLLKQGDPREVLERLIALRYPIYSEADIVVESRDVPAERTTQDVLDALDKHLERQPATGAA